jgi:Zn-dependent protease
MGMKLGKLFGIDFYVSPSWLVIFTFVLVSLGASAIPVVHPEWQPALVWAVALLCTVFIFISLVLHELGHALAARRYGINTSSIRLFLLGGVASIEDDPKTAKQEFVIAAAGPAVSLLIAIVCFVSALPTLPLEVPENDPFLQLSALNTFLLWTGITNIFLILFNMIPAFPLDGGRILRSLIWGLTGSYYRATLISTFIGQYLGFGMTLYGVALVFGYDLPLFQPGLGGLWLSLVGYFIVNNASNYGNYARLEMSLQKPIQFKWGDQLVIDEQDINNNDYLKRIFRLIGTDEAPLMRNGAIKSVFTLSGEERMLEPAEKLTPEDTGAHALKVFMKHPYQRLYIFHEDTLVGTVTLEELLHQSKHSELLS